MFVNNLSVNKIIEVHIEISKGSNIKYEYDHSNNKLKCDRILHNPLVYPFNYGYSPNTLSEDNDPIDVLVITNHRLEPNSYIDCKIVGVLLTEDESGIDNKIITVPNDNIDPYSKYINNIDDISTTIKDEILYFLNHYKDLEYNKWIVVKNYKDKDTAIEIYNNSKL